MVAGVMPFASSLRSMYGENAEIGSLSDVTIGIIEFMGIATGPIRRGDGFTPAVALVNPKFPHNVGAAVRAASCYGVRQVWFSGDRVRLDGAKRQRLPREERMRGYKQVAVRHADQFFDAFEEAVPVAVELRRNAESLIDFVHPEHALYVFGTGGWVARPGRAGPVPPLPGDSHPALRQLVGRCVHGALRPARQARP
jgi:hypothetical protein